MILSGTWLGFWESLRLMLVIWLISSGDCIRDGFLFELCVETIGSSRVLLVGAIVESFSLD